MFPFIFSLILPSEINKNNENMKEIINFITNRPMETALWLLLAVGIAFFLWICWRNIQRGRRERENQL